MGTLTSSSIVYPLAVDVYSDSSSEDFVMCLLTEKLEKLSTRSSAVGCTHSRLQLDNDAATPHQHVPYLIIITA